MTIEWTREARKALTPARGNATAPALVAPDARRRVLAAAWKYEEGVLRAGLSMADADAAALTERVFAYGANRWSDTHDARLDAELEGFIGCALLWGNPSPPTHEVMSEWLSRGGPAFAVRALAERGRWFKKYATAHGVYGTDNARAALAGVTPEQRCLFLGRIEEESGLLRQAILAADDAAYASVVDTVRSLREQGGLTLRASLDGLVPTEHAWARQSARDWLGEAPRSPGSGLTYDIAGALLAGLDDPELAEQVLRRLQTPYGLGRWAFDGVQAAGDRALEPLALYVESAVGDVPKANMGLAEARRLARALALFDDPRAARAFAPWVGDTRALGPVALEYFQAHPARAFETLGAQLLEKGKKAEPAQRLLEGLARGSTEAVTAVLASLRPDVRAAAEKLLGKASAPSSTEEAPLDALPPVLRAPPWRSKQSRPEIPVFESLTPPATPERVVWADEAERKGVIESALNGGDGGWDRQREIQLKKLATLLEGGPRQLQFYERVYLPFHAMPDEEAIRLFNETPLWVRDVMESGVWSEVAYMIARFGDRVFPALPAVAAEQITAPTFSALLHCDSVRLVPVILRGLARSATRRLAQRWLETYPSTASLGLIPIALGPASRAKNEAAGALRSLDAAGKRGIVLESAARFGDEVRRATELVLDADSLADCPKNPPKLSAYVDLATLPPLLLADGRRAPEAGVRNLLEMLQFTPADPPYAGIAQIDGVFQPASLDAVLRSLLNAWIASGGATASAWPLRAFGHAGSDDLARELAALVRRWPREKAKPRALLGVDVLGMMGTDLALMHLADLAKTAKNKDVEARAAERLAETAAARGLGPEDLDDRLTPTLGLERDGSTQIDFGPRAFRVAIDDQLELNLFDAEQHKLKSLPRASGDDDAELAKAGKARWQSMRDDLERVRASLLLRMELAMVRGRRWDAKTVQNLFVHHPIASRIARRLVWGVFEGDGRGRILTTFRIADDGTLADSDDKSFTVSGDEAMLGVVHPMEFAQGENDPALARWRTVLSDYELVQPFAQVDRRVTRVGAGDAASYYLPMPRDREVPYRMLASRLEARGYRLSAPDGEGLMNEFSRKMSETTVWIRFAPGHRVREAPPEKVSFDVSFGTGAKIGDVPALDVSEAFFDLAPFEFTSPK